MDVTSFVKSELAGADNIKSKTNRKNVSDNLTAILSELTTLNELPENGLAFFYGIEESGGTETSNGWFKDSRQPMNTHPVLLK